VINEALIQRDRWFAGKGAERRVLHIEGVELVFMVRGQLSAAPRRMTVADFAAWAEAPVQR
jgi:hypothetical protein